ncbi:MAG: SEC-C metal-binding domain-containing protein [Actinomycetota bacterium]
MDPHHVLHEVLGDAGHHRAEHLEAFNLRAMGQKDPLTEWQREGFEMFGAMMTGIAQDFVKYVMRVQVLPGAEPSAAQTKSSMEAVQNLQTSSSDDVDAGGFDAAASGDGAPQAGATTKQQTVTKDVIAKTPRNAPCPCGSGDKFKNCYGTPNCRI